MKFYIYSPPRALQKWKAAKTAHRFSRWLLVKTFFAAGYFSFLVYVVLFARRRIGMTERFLNPIPVIRSVESFLALSSQKPVDRWEYWLNLIGNVLLFMPLAFLLVSVARAQRLTQVLIAAAALSLFIEGLQYVCKRGVADADDVLLNVGGACIGFFICGWMRKMKLQVAKVAVPQHAIGK